MKKKILELFVCIALMCALFAALLDTLPADEDSEYTYTISNGKATITDYTCAGGMITIPSTLGGYPTVAIGDNAFHSCNFLTSVTIPNSVITIGNKAFYSCTSLTDMTIPDSVITIGDYAFYYCSSMNTVNIGNNVTAIGDYAFQYCSSLTKVNFGNIVSTIGDNAFSYCSSLASITIPDSILTIGDDAFSHCPLTTLNIGNNVTTLGDNAFSYCRLTTVTIPNSVKTIGMYAFYSCTSMTAVTIGNSVKTIGSSAFASCSSLTSITFLGLFAPTTVGAYWIKDTPIEIRGHAYAASNFPTPEGIMDFHGLKMGKVISVENIQPLAGFIWISLNLTVNQTITFDASTSFDPDGSLTRYEWDWNNDSVYEESFTTPTATHSWTQAGNYPITIRVTDNDNATSTKTITIPISNRIETNNKGTPGFEFVFIIGAMVVSILLWKKKRNK